MHCSRRAPRRFAPLWPLCASERRNVYARLRPQVETPENIGKLIVLDVGSGDYEIAADNVGSAESRRLQERHPNAPLFALRIGYNVVDVIGGALERTERT